MKPSISVRNLSKRYRLGLVHDDMLSNRLARTVRNVFGRRGTAEQSAGDRQEFWALRDLSFDVMPGEVVGIIGRNGAGKSTLLKILSRITPPTTGSIGMNGSIASLLEVGTGFHGELTGRENIHLNAAILGMRPEEIRKKFDSIVAFAEVDRFIDTPVKRYSSGMYVRLAFSVAAHLEPSILVVDEVLAVGDAAFQRKCLGKMDDLAREGRTVLFVSHQMGTIGRLCEVGMQLEQGRLVYHGPIVKVIEHYLETARGDGGPVRAFEDDESKDMNLRSVTVLDPSGEPTQTLDRSKPLRIAIEYVVRKPLRDAYANIVLSTEDDTVRIMESRDIDVAADAIVERKPGLYRSIVEFPGGILNVGNYYARVGLHATQKIVADFGDSPPFELMDVGDVGNYQTGKTASKRGLMAMRLNWDIQGPL